MYIREGVAFPRDRGVTNENHHHLSWHCKLTGHLLPADSKSYSLTRKSYIVLTSRLLSLRHGPNQFVLFCITWWQSRFHGPRITATDICDGDGTPGRCERARRTSYNTSFIGEPSYCHGTYTWRDPDASIDSRFVWSIVSSSMLTGDLYSNRGVQGT